MAAIALSYVITTRNKMVFLSRTLPRLLASAQPDEEIIVVDSASTDGTLEYLDNLHRCGQIHKYVSEPDRCEAHGFNKGLLWAEGKLVKILTDDDVFNFEAIRECRRFMEARPDIDIALGHVCNTSVEDICQILPEDAARRAYQRWRDHGGCFAFTGLSMMIRRTSLALTGLFLADTKNPDTEFSMRVSSMGLSLAWLDATIAIRIENSLSTMRFIPHHDRTRDLDRFGYFYDSAHRGKVNSVWFQIDQSARRLLRVARGVATPNRRRHGRAEPRPCGGGSGYSEKEFDACFAACDSYLSCERGPSRWLAPAAEA